MSKSGKTFDNYCTVEIKSRVSFNLLFPEMLAIPLKLTAREVQRLNASVLPTQIPKNLKSLEFACDTNFDLDCTELNDAILLALSTCLEDFFSSVKL